MAVHTRTHHCKVKKDKLHIAQYKDLPCEPSSKLRGLSPGGRCCCGHYEPDTGWQMQHFLLLLANGCPPRG